MTSVSSVPSARLIDCSMGTWTAGPSSAVRPMNLALLNGPPLDMANAPITTTGRIRPGMRRTLTTAKAAISKGSSMIEYRLDTWPPAMLVSRKKPTSRNGNTASSGRRSTRGRANNARIAGRRSQGSPLNSTRSQLGRLDSVAGLNRSTISPR